MSDQPVLKLAEFRERKRREGSIVLELTDGTQITLDPPELWSDKSRKVAADPKKTDEDLGKELFGAENWAAYVADGNTAGMLAELLRERHQLTVGESSASSTS